MSNSMLSVTTSSSTMPPTRSTQTSLKRKSSLRKSPQLKKLRQKISFPLLKISLKPLKVPNKLKVHSKLKMPIKSRPKLQNNCDIIQNYMLNASSISFSVDILWLVSYCSNSIIISFMNMAVTWGIVILALVVLSQGRIFETQFKFTLLGRNNGWIYLDKMTFAPGAATVEIQTSTTGLPYGRGSEIFMQAIKGPKWEKEVELQCKNPVRMPLAIHEIKLDGSISHSRIMFSIEDYETVYFVLKDCQSRLINDYNNTNLTLNVKLHLLNNDREIGEEEDHWYIVPFILAAGMLLVHLYIKEYKHQSEFDWPKILLFAGTVTQISSLCWKYFGFLIYLYTGSDHYFFHYIYLFLHSASESAVIALVTLVAFGWTLTFNSGQQFDLFLPLVGALGIINVIITMVTKIGHSHDVHHVFDNVGGTILMWFRVVIVLVFIYGCFKTFRGVRHNLKRFMGKLAVLGFIYIASTPIIVFSANYFVAAKNRHEFVFIAVEMTKFITNLLFTYELNSKYSEYNRVNIKNASFIPEGAQGFN